MPPRRHRSHGRSGADPSRRRLLGAPTTVWLITALWGSLLVGASLLWPMSYGYDEPQHIDMAYVYSADPFHFYGPGELLPTTATVSMQKQLPGYPPRQRFAVAPIPSRGERPSFADLGGHAKTTGTQPNQMVQHPPLYYWTEALVLRIPGVSHLGWDVQVWLMRLLSVLFLLPMPALCWATAHRLLTRFHAMADAPRLAALAAVVPLSLPNLIRDGSSVTNDSLLILTTSAVLYLACRVITGDLSRRTSIWMGVSLAAALLTKGFALVLPPVVLAAYLLGSYQVEHERRARLKVLWPALIAPVAGGVIGGLWWLRNLIDYGSVQVDGYGSAYDVVLYGKPDNQGTLGGFLPRFLSDFTARIWGGIGLPDQPSLGAFLVYGWFALVAVGVIAGLLAPAARGARRRSLALFSAAVLTMIVVMVGSFDTYRKWSSVPRGSQGRYLYHLTVILAALSAVGWLRVVQPRVRATLTPVVLIAAVFTNFVAWMFVLRTWYQPQTSSFLHGLSAAVHGVFRWSPVPKPLTAFLVAVLPAITSVVAVAYTLRDRRFARQAVAGGDVEAVAEMTTESPTSVEPAAGGASR